MSLRPKPSVVLFVDDVDRLTRFYREMAQMALAHEGTGHTVLELDGIQLVIHALRRPAGHSVPASGSIAVREDSHWKLGLPVASIAEARTTAAALGGFIAPVAKEWEARGFRACDGHDPEGNVFQVRESSN